MLVASALATARAYASPDDETPSKSDGGFVVLEHEPPTTRADAGGLWVAPVRFVQLHLNAIEEHARDYSTTIRPRDVVGALASWCERRAGAPCGHGIGSTLELESGIGYADAFAGAIRVRGTVGAGAYAADAELDRAYARMRHGPLSLEVGRDAFRFGPGARTNIGWSQHAAPLDHVRVSTAEPVSLGQYVDFSAHYLVGRLRAPQAISGNAVSITHAQLDVARDLHVGVIQLLQVAGDGSGMGFWDFVVEHVRRGDASASASDSSNRRFGGDISLEAPSLFDARLYYAVIFEDIRRARLLDAVRYDADHLVGADFRAIDRNRRHGLTIEWHQTGVRSQEHVPRTTGFTNRGLVVGAPLGPDSKSLYASGRIALGALLAVPWVELAQVSADDYEFVVDGPITRTTAREDEGRYRVGARIRVPVQRTMWLETEAAFEHVVDFEFVTGVTRNNAGIQVTLVWYPDGPVGRLELN